MFPSVSLPHYTDKYPQKEKERTPFTKVCSLREKRIIQFASQIYFTTGKNKNQQYVSEVKSLKIRKQAYGNSNMVGKNIERIRKEQGIKQKDFISKMQVMGCDMNPTSYSKLEGQIRIATDKEIYVIAKILNVPIDHLFCDRKE